MTDTETRLIDPDDAEILHMLDDGTPEGPWTKAAEQHVSEHRWYDRYWLVLRHEDGTHWGLKYDVGKTENQETEWPWEVTEDPLELTRLYPREVIRIEYGTAPAEPTPPLPADQDTTTA